MFSSDHHQTTSRESSKDDFSTITTTRIKPNFITEKELKKFLDGGGKIVEIPYGQRSDIQVTDFQRPTNNQKIKIKIKKDREASEERERIALPTKRSESIKHDEITRIAAPSKIVKPTKITEPVKAVEPAKITEHVEVVEPSNTTQPTKPVVTTPSPKEVAAAILITRPGINQQRKSKLEAEILSAKTRKAKKTKTEKAPLPKPTLSKEELVQKEKSKQEGIRLNNLKKAKLEAIANGEETFMAVCQKHDLTTYAFYGKTARCQLCRNIQNEKSLIRCRNKNPQHLEQMNQNSERLDRNFKAYTTALQKGTTSFIAECSFHGIGAFVIEKRSKHKTKGSYRCIECKKISHFVYRLTKKPAR